MRECGKKKKSNTSTPDVVDFLFSQLPVVQTYKIIDCDKHAQEGKANEQFYLKNICKSLLLAAEITVIMNIKYVIDRVKRIVLSFAECWCLIE